MMGVMLSAAGSFQWFKNQLAGDERRIESQGGKDAYEQLTKQAASIKPGSEGCVFYLICLVKEPLTQTHTQGVHLLVLA